MRIARTTWCRLALAGGLVCSPIACDDSRPAASPSSVAAPPVSLSATRKGNGGPEAVALHLPGVPNAYRVSPELYRGAQPTPEGFRALRRLGVKTVVNLRLLHSDRDEIGESGVGAKALRYEHIPMEAWDADEEEIIEFLRIVTDRNRTPVFVHCQHGADRTGIMVAAYRIAVQGWPRERAVDEMRHGPFGFHEIWTGLPRFLREMDVERIRAQVDTRTPQE